MDLFSALVLASLLVSPAPEGALLAKEVSTVHVDMDWTDVLPGIEILVDGTFHNTTLLFATQDPSVVRVEGLFLFHGLQGIRGVVPGVGLVTILIEAKISEVRVIGTFMLEPPIFLIPIDATLSLRSVGTLSVTAGGVTFTEEVNELLILQVRNGSIFWVRIGVPMGWPFQP